MFTDIWLSHVEFEPRIRIMVVWILDHYWITRKYYNLRGIYLPKAWIYLQNACCIQLNLVLRERVNRNCMRAVDSLLHGF